MLDKFYTSEKWIKTRERIIFDRLYNGETICEYCGKPIYDTIIGHHVKELTPYNVNDASIAYNPDNIQLVHMDCHNQIHQKLGKYQRVIIVCGSPYSGKTKYVRERIKKNDIVCDVDALYTALNPMTGKYIKSEIKLNVWQLQHTILDSIRTRYGYWGTAYIITTKKEDVERLCRELNAEAVYMESNESECIERLRKENNPQFVEKQQEKLIREWYKLYGGK